MPFVSLRKLDLEASGRALRLRRREVSDCGSARLYLSSISKGDTSSSPRPGSIIDAVLLSSPFRERKPKCREVAAPWGGRGAG